jgi:hypothetical protein
MRTPPADRPFDRHFSSRATFLALWLAPQLVALALCVFRVPLWARFPQAGELLALRLILGVQIAAASVMLPLFEDWTRAAAALLATWPVATIAASLSAAPLAALLSGEINVALWMIATTVAAMAFRSPRTRASAWTLAVMWTIGGGLLLYLRSEFPVTARPLPEFAAGPLVAAVRGATTGNLQIFLPLPPLIFLVLFLLAFQTRTRHSV